MTAAKPTERPSDRSVPCNEKHPESRMAIAAVFDGLRHRNDIFITVSREAGSLTCIEMKDFLRFHSRNEPGQARHGLATDKTHNLRNCSISSLLPEAPDARMDKK